MKTAKTPIFRLVVALVGSLVCSCIAQGKDVPFSTWVSTDKFNPGVTLIESTPILVRSPKFTSPWFARLQLKYAFADGEPGCFVFTIMYSGDKWAFWEKLRILVGQDAYEAEALGTPRREQAAFGTVEEVASFKVDTASVERLLRQSQIDMRLTGRNVYDFSLNNVGVQFLQILRDRAKGLDPHYSASLAIGGAAAADAAKAPVPQEGGTGSQPAYINELKALADMRDKGILSAEEFESRKKAILEKVNSQAPNPQAEAPQVKAEKGANGEEAPPAAKG